MVYTLGGRGGEGRGGEGRGGGVRGGEGRGGEGKGGLSRMVYTSLEPRLGVHTIIAKIRSNQRSHEPPTGHPHHSITIDTST